MKCWAGDWEGKMSMGRKAEVVFSSLKVFFTLFLMSEICKCPLRVREVVAVLVWTEFLHWIPLAASRGKAGKIPVWGEANWDRTGSCTATRAGGNDLAVPQHWVIIRAVSNFPSNQILWCETPDLIQHLQEILVLLPWSDRPWDSRSRDATAQALDPV